MGGSGSRLFSAALLVVAAGLAVGGSFGALTVSTLTTSSGTITTSSSGWWNTIDPPPAVNIEYVPLHGITLAIGAAMALTAAVMLAKSAPSGPDQRQPGRTLGVAAGALLVGVTVSIWLDLVAEWTSTAARMELDGPIAEYQYGIALGFGAWLLLAAGAVALVALIVLMVAGRRRRVQHFEPLPFAQQQWTPPPPQRHPFER
ncbi:hypothetical protein [Pseudonocardia sp. TRM90224]|uniref:hypothetical protein n=1 Tax=Pseudonocardia sp. TRM90224 TaxID=2812678 RepID=UPI001E3BE118|nr:hypothetical protein [Pseudonocardia sp. TRM90224]